jgi:glycosyltransferase involved in cell wall biosynthesis
MNILSINKFYWRKGGSESVFFNEMSLLEKNGHSVIPFSMKHKNNLESPYEKYFAEEVDYNVNKFSNKIENASKILFSFESRSKVKKLLNDYKIDLAHFHIFQHQISPSIFGPLSKRNIPLVLTLHDLKPICPNYKMYVNGNVCEECKGRRFYRSALNRCNKQSLMNSMINTLEMYLHYSIGYYQKVDRYIAVSRFYQNKMIEFGYPKEQVVYIPNMIDLPSVDLSSQDKGYALYFGRLSEEKDVSSLIMAMKQVPELKLVIAGTGPDEKILHNLKEKNQVDNIEFIGFKTGEELLRLISESSFTVIPSKWYENCPMSILESFAFGKPVIGANIGGIPELIDDESDGFHFTPERPDELAEKLKKMVSLGTQGRRDMGNNGYEKVKNNHSPDGHYEKLLSVYKSII